MDDDIIYEGCKKCGAKDYNNANFDDLLERPDGKFVVMPDSCDKCDLMLMLSDSNLLH